MNHLVAGTSADIQALRDFMAGVEMDAREGRPAHVFRHHAGPSWGEALLNPNGSLLPLLRLRDHGEKSGPPAPDHALRKLSAMIQLPAAAAPDPVGPVEDDELPPEMN